MSKGWNLLGDVARLDPYDLLDRQMAIEFAASEDYLKIAAGFSHKRLDGFASWFRKQSEEEREHALKIYDFLILAEYTPSFDFKVDRGFGPESCLGFAIWANELEKDNSSCVKYILNIARDKNAEGVVLLMQWFFEEQMEEEKWARDLLSQIGSVKDDDFASLWAFSEEWGRRAAL